MLIIVMNSTGRIMPAFWTPIKLQYLILATFPPMTDLLGICSKNITY